MGKESKKKCMYIYLYTELIPFAIHLKRTQHCKSTILKLKKKKKVKTLLSSQAVKKTKNLGNE